MAEHRADELFIGLCDAMIAFGVALANRGLLTREEIADMMRIVGEQQRRHEGYHPSRSVAADALRDFFSRPVAPGHGTAQLYSIQGGKLSEPSPSTPPSDEG